VLIVTKQVLWTLLYHYYVDVTENTMLLPFYLFVYGSVKFLWT